MTRWQTVLPVSPLPDRIAGWHLSRRVTESKRRVFIISCQMYLVHNYLIALVYGQKESVHSPIRQMDCKQVSRRVLRSEEHTSELQSSGHLVCRLLLEKTK